MLLDPPSQELQILLQRNRWNLRHGGPEKHLHTSNSNTIATCSRHHNRLSQISDAASLVWCEDRTMSQKPRENPAPTEHLSRTAAQSGTKPAAPLFSFFASQKLLSKWSFQIENLLSMVFLHSVLTHCPGKSGNQKIRFFVWNDP